MLFEITFHCKGLLTGGALKWPRVAVNCLVLGESRLCRKCFRANPTLVSQWYASVHHLVSLKVALLPERFVARGAMVVSGASVHYLVLLKGALLCKRFGARRAVEVSGASVHYLVLLEGALLPERLGTGGAAVRLNAGVHQLVSLEMKLASKAFVALLTPVVFSSVVSLRTTIQLLLLLLLFTR